MSWIDLLWNGAFLVAGSAITVGARWVRRWKLRKPVDEAYKKVRLVIEPEIINPAKPGNPDYMFSDARDTITVLRPRLRRAGFFPPSEGCEGDMGGLENWFVFLRHARGELN